MLLYGYGCDDCHRLTAWLRLKPGYFLYSAGLQQLLRLCNYGVQYDISEC